MTSHYHYGYGIAGYGPGEPRICESIACLADCVRQELSGIADSWADQAHGERTQLTRLQALRPTSGADPTGYEGSWESIADAAIRALECLDGAEGATALAFNLRPERRDTPLYQGDTPAWGRELRRLLLDSGTYPLTTDITGYHRFYVWECREWRCLLNEHDAEHEIPAASASGGYVPCACQGCMDILVWTPEDAPYCVRCVGADCAHRDRAGCAAVGDHG